MHLQKKKILYIITKSNWGGAQRYVYDLATNLPKDRYDVVVAFGLRGRLAEKLTEAGIRTYQISSLQRDLSLHADIKSFFELVHLLRRERPDIVHLNSSKAGGVGSLAAHLARIPKIVFTAHGWPFWSKRNIVWRAFAWLGSWGTALLSHTIIVVSKYDLKLARALPFCKSKMHVVHNGIDLNMPFESGDLIRQSFPKGMRITGTIGELTGNKNQVQLIDEARNNPTMHFAIVGEGEDRAMLEQKIAEYGLQERVKLFGFMTAERALKGFDEFVLPSLKEGLPYVLIEARAAGLPIRANRIGGIPEILDEKDMNEFSLQRMLEKTCAVYEQ